MKALPKIGVPRVYETGELPILYPGECATSAITPEDFRQAVLEATARGADRFDLSMKGWLVEPAPGWHAWYLRWRWRLVGRWFAGPPKLEARVSKTRGTS